MSRKLTGTKNRTATGWTASLPVHRGATKRQRYLFRSEYAAERWLDAGRAALSSAEPLPEPPQAELVAGAAARPAGTPFRRIATEWADEHFQELRRADVPREEAVRRHIRRIADFMEQRNLTIEKMTREQVKALQATLTRTPVALPTITVPEGLDPDRLVTRDEAVALPGMASRATLKRRIHSGHLVAAEKTQSGHRYRIGDLYTEEVLGPTGVGPTGELRRGPRRHGSVAQDVATDVMRVFEAVCLYATDHQIEVPQDRASLKMHLTDKPQAPDRRPVPLTTCVEIGRHLHAVHQIALFLMRVLGLRIGEAFGIQVCDILDQGPDQPGAVIIRAQGGRKFQFRGPDGGVVTSDRKEKLKNRWSRRVLVVPPMLMDLIRAAIEVFHTDADGRVRLDARLIPGLQRRDASGQSTFRGALVTAAARARIDCPDDEDSLDAVFAFTPHDTRRTLLSDLDHSSVKDSHIQRLAGHVPGPTVLHRHYLLDDPKLGPAHEVAALVERELRAEIPAGLMVPTLVRCTSGNQQDLANEALRIDVELAERGWLVVLSDRDGDALLGASEVAAELGVTPKTAREWMAHGQVPSIDWSARARGVERRSRLSDVIQVRERLAARVTLKSLAEEVDQPYHTVYQYVRAQSLPLEAWGERDYLVPVPTAEHLRVHYARQAALHRRAVPLSVAASSLNADVAVIQRLVQDGVLIEDDRAHNGRRMVTRASVEAAKAYRVQRGRRSLPPRTDLLPWVAAKEATGLTDAQLESLVAEGALERVQQQRRRHLTQASLLRYLAEHAPERLMIR